MSTLKVNQIRAKLRSMFEVHLDLTDIGSTDPDRDPKILSRCLAALAVHLQTGCAEKEAAAAVWDGSGDNGIDAAYFDTSESRVIFVQAKWINKGSGEPEAKEIGAFAKGVRDTIEQDDTNFHPRLQARFADIALRLETPGTHVHLLVISTGASHLAPPGEAVLQDFLKELNGEDPEPIASIETVGLSEVYEALASDAAPQFQDAGRKGILLLRLFHDTSYSRADTPHEKWAEPGLATTAPDQYSSLKMHASKCRFAGTHSRRKLRGLPAVSGEENSGCLRRQRGRFQPG